MPASVFSMWCDGPILNSDPGWSFIPLAGAAGVSTDRLDTIQLPCGIPLIFMTVESIVLNVEYFNLHNICVYIINIPSCYSKFNIFLNYAQTIHTSASCATIPVINNGSGPFFWAGPGRSRHVIYRSGQIGLRRRKISHCLQPCRLFHSPVVITSNRLALLNSKPH